MSVPTFTQSPNYSQQPRKSRIWLWIVLGSAIGVLLFSAHSSLDASNSGSAFIKHLLTASQLGGYGLASALVFPLVAAVLLLVFTRGRLSYKPDRIVEQMEIPRLEGASSTNV